MLYQPAGFQINESWDNALGTKSEFVELCDAAHVLGLKIMVEAVVGYVGSDDDHVDEYDNVSTKPMAHVNPRAWEFEPEILAAQAFHSPWVNCTYKERYWDGHSDYDIEEDLTQHAIDGKPDLATETQLVQDAIFDYFVELAEAGADGFYFNDAKHIETASDTYFSSDFWEDTLGKIREYYPDKNLQAVAELIGGSGDGRGAEEYLQYGMNLTHTAMSDTIRDSVIYGTDITDAFNEAFPQENSVLWGESYKSYANGETSVLTSEQRAKIWALTVSRKGVKGIYLARPSDELAEGKDEVNNILSTITLGEANVTDWSTETVKRVNHFASFFEDADENVHYDNGFAVIERGEKGAVLVNMQGKEATVSLSENTLADGEYTDAITGNIFTVVNGGISGDIGESGIAVLYQSGPVQNYNLWVGGEQVTSENAADVFGDGKVSYDATTNTLTLNNYTYTGTGYKWIEGDYGIYYDYYAAIYYGGADMFNLVLEGTSTVTQQSETMLEYSYGIYSFGNIAVSGSGNLTVTGDETNDTSIGMNVVQGGITVSGSCSLTAIGGMADIVSLGVYAYGSVIVADNSSLTATGGESGKNSVGVNVNDSITVSGSGSLTATGGTATKFDSYGVYASGSITVSGSGSMSATGGTATTRDSCGIYADSSVIVSDNGSLTAIGGEANNISYGVYAYGDISLLGGETIASGNTQAFYKAPTIDSSFTNAAVWYGESADEADNAGAKPIADLEDNYYQKYVKIAEGTVAPVTHSVKVVAVDAIGGDALAGAHLQILNDNNTVVDEWVSTKTTHEVEGLETGVTYTLCITVAPDGYTVPTDATFTIHADGTVTYSGDKTNDSVLLVKLEQTAVRFSAVDALDNMALEGAHLQILNDNNTIVDEWVSAVDNEETEDIDESICEVIGLETGTAYTLRTIFAPDGYTIPEDLIFSIDEDGKVTSSTDEFDNDVVMLIKFKPTVVKIRTVDADGNAPAGATIHIIDRWGNVVEEWVSAEDNEETEDIDESICEVIGLETGTAYTLRTTVAPDGYVFPDDTTFTIGTDGTVDYTGDMTDDGVLLVKFPKTVTYTVTITNNIANGTVTADKEKYAEGETVKLTVTPAEGYALRSVTINGTRDETVIGKTEVSFTMPAEDVAIFATFEEGIVVYFDNSESQWTHVICRYSNGHYQGRSLGNGIYGMIVPEGETVKFTNFMPSLPESEYPEGLFITEEINPEHGQTYHYVGYDIIVDESITGGTVTPEVTKASYGQNVMLTAIPDSGMTVKQVIVKDENQIEITVTNTENTYSFIMPAGNVTVSALFEEEATITYYRLWVGGVQVTSANAADVFGNGKVSYDYSTNTLTLNGYSYSGEGRYDSAIHYENSDTLNLVSVGENILSGTSRGVNLSNGSSLIVTGDSLFASGSEYGVFAAENITFIDSNVTVDGGVYGVGAIGTITISGGEVIAQGGEMAFIYPPTIADTFTNAAVWYGEDEEAAIAAGEKPISNLASKYNQKYVRVAEGTGGGEEDTESAVITGLSITIDGVTYDSSNTSADSPAVITPDTRSVSLTVHGTNLQNGTDNNIVFWCDLGGNSLSEGWEISTDGTTATGNLGISYFDTTTTAFEMLYTNDYRQTINGSGVYIIYDDSIAEEDSTVISGISITIDGVTYDSSNTSADSPAVITPDTQTIIITAHGTNLQNGTQNQVVNYVTSYILFVTESHGWEFSTDGTTATADFSATNERFASATTAFEMQYSNKGNTGIAYVGSGVYIIYNDSTGEEPVTTYDLWVGGEQITSEKLTVSDGSGGTATYDPDTNILTLDGINITSGYKDENDRVIGIYADGDLNIELAGENDITMPDDNNKSYGIRVKGDLSVSGSGSLNVVAGNVTAQDSEEHYSTGIHTSGYLNIYGATVYAKGGNVSAEGDSYSRGVYPAGGLQVDFGGSLTAEGGNAKGNMAYSTGLEALGEEEYINISIYDGNLIAKGGDTEGVIIAESNGVYLEIAGFYVYDNTANVELTSGNAKVTSDDESTEPYAYSNGITVYEGDIAIYGGTVEITGGTWEGIDGDGWAVYVEGEEDEEGVISGGNVLIEWENIELSPSGYGFIGSKVTITSTDEEKGAIFAGNGLEIGDKLIISQPEGGKVVKIEEENYAFDTVLNTDDSLAKSVVIEPLIYSVKIEGMDNDMSVLVPDNTSINEAYKDMLEEAEITDFSDTINTEKSGYTFDGFYTESGEKFDFDDSVNSDMTITAKWTKKSYGGGSSSTITTTTNNDDGSTTKTTTNKITGTVTKTTTYADGSTTKVETKKDGTEVTTETTADGETKTEIDLPKDKETEVTIPVSDAEDVTSITVTDKDGKETEITDFEITEDGIKITVSGDCTAVVSKAAKKEFADVHPVNHWSEESVDYVYIRGLMMGTSETHFSPDVPLTRAMLVTVLYRLEGEPKVSGITSFADLEKGQYYLDAVCWAQVNGIVNGVSKTEFAPNDNITREQIAAIMHRYAQYKGYDVSVGENTNILSYDDFDSISEYAIASMQYAVGSGLIKGKSESTLNPLDNATRAEAAAILERFIKAN